jgi:two-component system OmpR family response regulator
MHILVVDDDPDCTAMLQQILESEGHQVHTEGDGAAALRALSLYWPDLMLLDVMLPGLDGLDVCARVRAMQRDRPYLPIILLTALHARTYRALGALQGADGYVTKPFDLDTLLATVQIWRQRAAFLG